MKNKDTVCIFGLGYVGLPLSICFSKSFKVIGYDTDLNRIKHLQKGKDLSGECKKIPSSIKFTNNLVDCQNANIFIVTVPTPVDSGNNPDLGPLRKASEDIANILKEGDYIIYESTVFPGVTEDFCVPIIEKISKLKVNKDFFVGYSPERIVPGGDKDISQIKKIVSGSNKKASKRIELIYSKIIKAGVYLTSSIKVAEAAKVIENTQRDLNIALLNELSVIFNQLGISTKEVVDAASTKWNFVKYSPGLVGGHCIGIDPYYLTFKAKKSGINPKLILTAREINEGMSHYICNVLIEKFIEKNIKINNSRILILGYTFKENCADDRNTKVKDIIEILEKYGSNITVYDPYIKKKGFLNRNPLEDNAKENYEAVVIPVSHKQFHQMDINKVRSILKPGGLIFDLKGIFPTEKVDFQL